MPIVRFLPASKPSASDASPLMDGGHGDTREGPLESFRRAEIDLLRPWFKQGSRVLEIGGGSGYQARMIESWGCTTLSIDLASRAVSAVRFHPVVSYDGTNIPARANSFDVVFSSNVLEHVENLGELLPELHRVVKPGGMVIHVLPSVSWRFWTSVAHYIFLLKYLAGVRDPLPGVDLATVSERAKKKGALHLLQRALLAGPHGIYPSALSELYYFSRRRWRRVFEANGFTVERACPSGIYNSGYVLWPGLSIDRRRGLSKILGSSTNIFVMRARR